MNTGNFLTAAREGLSPHFSKGKTPPSPHFALQGFFTNRLCLMLNRNVLTEISLVFLSQGLLGSHFLSLGGPENLTVSYPAHG